MRKHLDKVLSDPDTTPLDVYLSDLVAYLTNQPTLLEQTEEEEELAMLHNALQELFHSQIMLQAQENYFLSWGS